MAMNIPTNTPLQQQIDEFIAEGQAGYPRPAEGVAEPYRAAHRIRRCREGPQGGATSETLEGDWHPHLLAVGEFESVEQALRWYNSPEYAPAKELRFKTTKSRAIVVQGL